MKEGVDNSLDACEQAGILPELKVEIGTLGKDELSIAIEDNGPGIVEENVPNVFGRLLYGSRFGSGKQSRGQQGIGISAAIMYGQLTTGRSAIISTRISEEHLATRIAMKLDTRNNRGNVEREIYVGNKTGKSSSNNFSAINGGRAQDYLMFGIVLSQTLDQWYCRDNFTHRDRVNPYDFRSSYWDWRQAHSLCQI